MRWGKATAKLREKLGESLASVQKFDQPLERATTTSLEALQEFTRGESLHIGQAEDMAAMPHYLRATELDPNFAVAIGRLGTIYNNLGRSVEPEISGTSNGVARSRERA